MATEVQVIDKSSLDGGVEAKTSLGYVQKKMREVEVASTDNASEK